LTKLENILQKSRTDYLNSEDVYCVVHVKIPQRLIETGMQTKEFEKYRFTDISYCHYVSRFSKNTVGLWVQFG